MKRLMMLSVILMSITLQTACSEQAQYALSVPIQELAKRKPHEVYTTIADYITSICGSNEAACDIMNRLSEYVDTQKQPDDQKLYQLFQKCGLTPNSAPFNQQLVRKLKDKLSHSNSYSKNMLRSFEREDTNIESAYKLLTFYQILNKQAIITNNYTPIALQQLMELRLITTNNTVHPTLSQQFEQCENIKAALARVKKHAVTVAGRNIAVSSQLLSNLALSALNNSQ